MRENEKRISLGGNSQELHTSYVLCTFYCMAGHSSQSQSHIGTYGMSTGTTGRGHLPAQSTNDERRRNKNYEWRTKSQTNSQNMKRLHTLS